MEQVSLPPNLATDSPQVTSQTPAQKQISAADILIDAHDSRAALHARPQQTIQDLEELRLFQLAKRKDYEQQLNKNRLNFPQWMRYAKWELEHNHDFRRFRSIMERALEVDAKHVPFWVRYIELELLHQNVNHARNLLERAVSVLPRVDKFWFMYVQTEESIGNFRGVRLVFERWILWKPDGNVWETYISFEQRYNELDHVRSLYLRYVSETGLYDVWRKWALYEAGLVATEEQVARTRGVFEAAIDDIMEGTVGTGRFGPGTSSESGTAANGVGHKGHLAHPSVDLVKLIVLWINWEHSQGEVERAKAIYQKVLETETLDKDFKVALLDQLDIAAMENDESKAVQKRLRYQQKLSNSAQDYDTWWEYAKFQEKTEGLKQSMQVLQDAVATAPTDTYKLVTWRRYVFLWIKRALYSEYRMLDIDGARAMWKQARAVVPANFSFAKVWLHSAEFELRNGGDVHAYRKMLGAAIGQCCQKAPKPKIFKLYIAFEQMLGEYARVRKLYEKWAELAVVSDVQNNTSSAVSVFQHYIEFETELGESERVIALYEVALTQTGELLLDEYIGFLKDEFRYDMAREVLRKFATDALGWVRLALLESSILSLAQMDELQAGQGHEMHFEVGADHVSATRQVFEQGYKQLKKNNDGAGANKLLDSWKEYELMHGTDQYAEAVENKRPKPVARRSIEDGVEQVFYEYEFPDAKPDLSKFLANARKWKTGA